MTTNKEELLKIALQKQEERLKRLGITYEREERVVINPETNEPVLDEQGNPVKQTYTVIKKLSPFAYKVQGFFSMNAPCEFPGCEELRGQYLAELESLGGADCPRCAKNDLIRKYQDIVMDRVLGNERYIVQKAQHELHEGKTVNHYIPAGMARTDEQELEFTRAGEVSESSGPSEKGAAAGKSLLRKAAGYIAKIFSFSKRKEKR